METAKTAQTQIVLVILIDTLHIPVGSLVHLYAVVAKALHVLWIIQVGTEFGKTVSICRFCNIYPVGEWVFHLVP